MRLALAQNPKTDLKFLKKLDKEHSERLEVYYSIPPRNRTDHDYEQMYKHERIMDSARKQIDQRSGEQGKLDENQDDILSKAQGYLHANPGELAQHKWAIPTLTKHGFNYDVEANRYNQTSLGISDEDVWSREGKDARTTEYMQVDRYGWEHTDHEGVDFRAGTNGIFGLKKLASHLAKHDGLNESDDDVLYKAKAHIAKIGDYQSSEDMVCRNDTDQDTLHQIAIHPSHRPHDFLLTRIVNHENVHPDTLLHISKHANDLMVAQNAANMHNHIKKEGWGPYSPLKESDNVLKAAHDHLKQGTRLVANKQFEPVLKKHGYEFSTEWSLAHSNPKADVWIHQNKKHAVTVTGGNQWGPEVWDHEYMDNGGKSPDDEYEFADGFSGHTVNGLDRHLTNVHRPRPTNEAKDPILKAAQKSLIHSLSGNDKVEGDTHVDILHVLATNPTTDGDALHDLATHHTDWNVRAPVIRHPNVQERTLRFIHGEAVKDDNMGLRYEIARSRNTPVGLLKTLSKDKHWEVKGLASLRLSRHPNSILTNQEISDASRRGYRDPATNESKDDDLLKKVQANLLKGDKLLAYPHYAEVLKSHGYKFNVGLSGSSEGHVDTWTRTRGGGNHEVNVDSLGWGYHDHKRDTGEDGSGPEDLGLWLHIRHGGMKESVDEDDPLKKAHLHLAQGVKVPVKVTGTDTDGGHHVWHGERDDLAIAFGLAQKSQHPEVLHKLASHEYHGVRADVAENPHTTPDTLDYLAKDPKIVLNVLYHEKTSPETITRVYHQIKAGYASGIHTHRNVRSVKYMIAAHPNTPHEVLKELIEEGGSVGDRAYNTKNHPNGKPEGEVNEGKSLPVAPNDMKETHLKLANDPDPEVRAELGRSRNCHPDVLAHLSTDKEYGVKFAVARNPVTPVGTLHRLSKDAHEDIRMGVARNPNTHGTVLKKLSNDRSIRVRFAVSMNTKARRLGLRESHNDSILRDAHRKSLVSVPKNSEDEEAGEDTFHRALAKNTSDPETLAKLAHHWRVSVRDEVIDNPNTPHKALVTMWHRPGVGFYTQADIEKHPNWKISESDDLLKDAHMKIAADPDSAKDERTGVAGAHWYLAHSTQDPDVLHQLSKSPDRYVRIHVARNIDTSLETLISLRDQEDGPGHYVAHHPTFKKAVRDMKVLSDKARGRMIKRTVNESDDVLKTAHNKLLDSESDASMGARLAANSPSEYVHARLLKDMRHNREVHDSLARNPNTSLETQRHLYQIADHQTRDWMAVSKHTHSDILRQMTTDYDDGSLGLGSAMAMSGSAMAMAAQAELKRRGELNEGTEDDILKDTNELLQKTKEKLLAGDELMNHPQYAETLRAHDFKFYPDISMERGHDVDTWRRGSHEVTVTKSGNKTRWYRDQYESGYPKSRGQGDDHHDLAWSLKRSFGSKMNESTEDDILKKAQDYIKAGHGAAIHKDFAKHLHSKGYEFDVGDSMTGVGVDSWKHPTKGHHLFVRAGGWSTNNRGAWGSDLSSLKKYLKLNESEDDNTLKAAHDKLHAGDDLALHQDYVPVLKKHGYSFDSKKSFFDVPHPNYMPRHQRDYWHNGRHEISIQHDHWSHIINNHMVWGGKGADQLEARLNETARRALMSREVNESDDDLKQAHMKLALTQPSYSFEDRPLTHSTDEYHIRDLAVKRVTDPDVLHTLSKDPDRFIRRIVAGHEHTRIDTLRELVNDNEDHVTGSIALDNINRLRDGMNESDDVLKASPLEDGRRQRP